MIQGMDLAQKQTIGPGPFPCLGAICKKLEPLLLCPGPFRCRMKITKESPKFKIRILKISNLKLFIYSRKDKLSNLKFTFYLLQINSDPMENF